MMRSMYFMYMEIILGLCNNLMIAKPSDVWKMLFETVNLSLM